MVNNHSSHNETVLRSEQGLSLIEVIVAIGVLSVVMVATMTMNSNQALNLASLESKLAEIGLNKEIADHVALSQTCMAAVGTDQSFNLSAAQSNEGHPITLRMSDGSVLAQDAVLEKHGQLRVDRLVLKNPVAAGTDGSGNSIYLARIETQYSPTRATMGPKVYAPKVASSLFIATNSSNAIVNCYGIQVASSNWSQICDFFNGTYDEQNSKCILDEGELSRGTGGGGSVAGGTCTAGRRSPTCVGPGGYIMSNPNYDPDSQPK